MRELSQAQIEARARGQIAIRKYKEQIRAKFKDGDIFYFDAIGTEPDKPPFLKESLVYINCGYKEIGDFKLNGLGVLYYRMVEPYWPKAKNPDGSPKIKQRLVAMKTFLKYAKHGPFPEQG